MIRRLFRRRPSWYEEAAAYLDGELRGPARAAFEQELDRSADLRAYLEDLRATKRAIAALPPVQLPRSFTISVAQARAATRAPRLERRAAAPAASGGWFAGTALVRSVAAFSVVAVAALAAVVTVDVAGDNGQGPRQGMAEQQPAAAEDRTAATLRQDSASQSEQAAKLDMAAAQTARVQSAPAEADADSTQAAAQTAEPALAAPAPADEPTAADDAAPMVAEIEADSGDGADAQSGTAEEEALPAPDGSDGISAVAPAEAGDVETPPSDSGDDVETATTLVEEREEGAPAADTVDVESLSDDTAVAQTSPGDGDVTAEVDGDAPPVAQPEEPTEQADAPTEERATGGGLAHEPGFEADEAGEAVGGAEMSGDAAEPAAFATEQATLEDEATEQATLDEQVADQTAESATESAPTAAPAEPDAAPSPTTALLDGDEGTDILLIALEIALGALVGLSLVTLFVVIRRRA